MVIAWIASGEESAPISISAALPGNASRTRKMISEAPASVATSVRRRRRMKTLTAGSLRAEMIGRNHPIFANIIQ
jgi:hypothetical protein